MRLFRPPATQYSNNYDIMRFNLVWNLALVIGTLLLLVSAANIQNHKYSSLINLIEVGVGIICLVVLYRTRRFETVSKIAALGSFAILAYAYFMIHGVLHYTTPMWSVVNVLFTYFLLGRWWGLGMLSGHVILLIFYYIFRLEINVKTVIEFDNAVVLNFIFETISVGLALGYLMHTFIVANSHAEQSVISNNEELLEQNQIISSQHREKEIMLKEIHHRVKNNLQVITSLLRLQAMELDATGAESFSEAINRVKSMALIHEKMYSSDLLSNFNLENYLHSLTNDLIETYAIEKPIQLEVSTELDHIGSKTIVPLSLLFNELISNSIKHGFLHKNEGRIQVKVARHAKPDFFILNYSDDGEWGGDSKKSFGLELIDTMTDQLEGSYSIETGSMGTHYSFELRSLTE